VDAGRGASGPNNAAWSHRGWWLAHPFVGVEIVAVEDFEATVVGRVACVARRCSED